ncbi:MAG: hypothetical protein VXV96_17905 [Bdellovibrionota bacterium]|nr:hypothetical protein [Bdellovibrionota bacterium]
MRVITTTLLLFILASCSCKKEEVLWSQLDMWKMAYEFDKTIEVVPIPDTPEGALKRVLCSNYRTEGCTIGTGKRIKIRLVEILVLRYDSARNACLAALEIGQWHAKNWLFDDVTNEPVLIDFVQKVFDAKKPKEIADCEL